VFNRCKCRIVVTRFEARAQSLQSTSRSRLKDRQRQPRTVRRSAADAEFPALSSSRWLRKSRTTVRRSAADAEFPALSSSRWLRKSRTSELRDANDRLVHANASISLSSAQWMVMLVVVTSPPRRVATNGPLWTTATMAASSPRHHYSTLQRSPVASRRTGRMFGSVVPRFPTL
jgi:hypothetical protein